MIMRCCWSILLNKEKSYLPAIDWLDTLLLQARNFLLEAKNTLDEYSNTRQRWQPLFYHEIR